MPTAPGVLGEKGRKKGTEKKKRKRRGKRKKTKHPTAPKRTTHARSQWKGGGFLSFGFLLKAKWDALGTARTRRSRGSVVPMGGGGGGTWPPAPPRNANEPKRLFLGSLVCSLFWLWLRTALGAAGARHSECSKPKESFLSSLFPIYLFNISFILELLLCFQCYFRTCQPQPRVGGAGGTSAVLWVGEPDWDWGGGWAQGWGSPISLRKHKSPAAREQQQENTPSTSSPPLGYLGLWKCLAGQSQSQLPGSPGAVRYIQCLSAVYMAQPGGAARNSSNGSANTPFFRVEMYLCCFFFCLFVFFFLFFFCGFFFVCFFFPLSLSLS